jgi:hypothetical protein
MRDYFVFTDKRFVLVGKQGLTGSKVEYHWIPDKSIPHFSIETAGTFDFGCGAEDLDFRVAKPHSKAVQQTSEHLRDSVRARQLRASVTA